MTHDQERKVTEGRQICKMMAESRFSKVLLCDPRAGLPIAEGSSAGDGR